MSGIDTARAALARIQEQQRQRQIEADRREEEARQLENLRIAKQMERLQEHLKHQAEQEAGDPYADELSKIRNRYDLDD